MIRVLFLEEGPGFGGALVSLKNLMESMCSQEFRFYLITNYDQDYITPTNNIVDVQVIKRKRIYGYTSQLEKVLRYVMGNKAGPLAYLIDKVTFCHAYVGRISRYIRENGIDILHLNNWPLLNDGGLFAAKKTGVPVVMHVRGWEYDGRLIKWLINQADHIIAISDYIKERILAMDVQRTRVSLIPDTINFESFVQDANGAGFRHEMGIPAKSKVVGIVGCLVDWKGHKVFLEAFARVLTEISAIGVVVGDTPDKSSGYRKELENHAKNLGIYDRIYFVGHRKDVASVMDAFDVVVHASTSPEPFGMVIIEAMALGKAVIATAAGGPKEIIEDGINGLLVPPSDVSTLADSLLRLLRCQNVRYRLGKAGRETVKTKYNVALYSQRILDIYKRLEKTSPRAKVRLFSNKMI